MNDLVRRLRQHALPDPHDEREVMHAPLLTEAADEIEKLRDEVNYHREDAKKWNHEFKASYRREVEATDQLTRCRAVMEQAVDAFERVGRDQWPVIEEALTALREALKEK